MKPVEQAILGSFNTIEDRRQRTGYYKQNEAIITNFQVGKELSKAKVGEKVTHSHNLRIGCSYTGEVLETYKENGYVYYVVRRDYVTIDGTTRPCNTKEQKFTDTIRTKDIKVFH
jgi:hypothetical protein